MVLIQFTIARKKSNATMTDSLAKLSTRLDDLVAKLSTRFNELVEALGSRGYLTPPQKAPLGPTTCVEFDTTQFVGMSIGATIEREIFSGVEGTDQIRVSSCYMVGTKALTLAAFSKKRVTGCKGKEELPSEQHEALFSSLYKSFSNVLMERLPSASSDATLHDLRSGQIDAMNVDSEESSAMEIDRDNGRPKKRGRSNEYDMGDKEQWCLSTLGYVKAFSRQYATEIWPHIEKLVSEVFTEDAHPLFRKAFYSGLRWPIHDF
ncbi:hypothetical protein GIB67_015182 [Kingdonia uniflora]|uniref:Uncharacterized protein n=1 Tax=Kingdonia uniflora TaxID=39325 RepID=A0A7J7LJ59_9MAGN|nr:hypothetical protein GIB67_015182 [Kingdonia uniflora]